MCVGASITNYFGFRFTPSHSTGALKKKLILLHLIGSTIGLISNQISWWSWCENLSSNCNPSYPIREMDAFYFFFVLFFFGLGDLFCFLQLACLCMLIWGARLLFIWWRPIGIDNRELNVEHNQVPLLSFPAGQLFCISPPGGGVPVPPLPIHWYYIMAAGGALLLLAVAILVRALCCCRQHLATKKSQLSVAYHSSSQCFQYSNWSSSMAAPGVEPVLTVRLDSRDRHRTLCWKEALSCIVFGKSGRQLVMSVAVMLQDWPNIHSTSPSFL